MQLSVSVQAAVLVLCICMMSREEVSQRLETTAQSSMANSDQAHLVSNGQAVHLPQKCRCHEMSVDEKPKKRHGWLKKIANGPGKGARRAFKSYEAELSITANGIEPGSSSPVPALHEIKGSDQGAMAGDGHSERPQPLADAEAKKHVGMPCSKYEIALASFPWNTFTVSQQWMTTMTMLLLLMEIRSMSYFDYTYARKQYSGLFNSSGFPVGHFLNQPDMNEWQTFKFRPN